MKKKSILFIVAFVSTFISLNCVAQSYKIGNVDQDGNPHITISENDCMQKLEQLSAQESATPVQITELSFTRLPKGQICITGYEKNNQGAIVRGVRIQCSQDDENNLIINSKSNTEYISGGAFSSLVNPK